MQKTYLVLALALCISHIMSMDSDDETTPLIKKGRNSTIQQLEEFSNTKPPQQPIMAKEEIPELKDPNKLITAHKTCHLCCPPQENYIYQEPSSNDDLRTVFCDPYKHDGINVCKGCLDKPRNIHCACCNTNCVPWQLCCNRNVYTMDYKQQPGCHPCRVWMFRKEPRGCCYPYDENGKCNLFGANGMCNEESDHGFCNKHNGCGFLGCVSCGIGTGIATSCSFITAKFILALLM